MTEEHLDFSDSQETHADHVLPNNEVFEKEDKLLKDKQFLIEVAISCDASYRKAEIDRLREKNEEIPDRLHTPLFTEDEQNILLSTPDTRTPDMQKLYAIAQEKLAKNLAGLYALQEGLGILALIHTQNPTDAYDTLVDLEDGKTDDPFEAELFSRLAHEAWAAGQPFRDRETIPTMTVFDKLSSDEKAKDMRQVVAASQVLKRYLDAAPTPEPIIE